MLRQAQHDIGVHEIAQHDIGVHGIALRDIAQHDTAVIMACAL